jgi:hypothetical protein
MQAYPERFEITSSRVGYAGRWHVAAQPLRTMAVCGAGAWRPTVGRRDGDIGAAILRERDVAVEGVSERFGLRRRHRGRSQRAAREQPESKAKPCSTGVQRAPALCPSETRRRPVGDPPTQHPGLRGRTASRTPCTPLRRSGSLTRRAPSRASTMPRGTRDRG